MAHFPLDARKIKVEKWYFFRTSSIAYHQLLKISRADNKPLYRPKPWVDLLENSTKTCLVCDDFAHLFQIFLVG